MIPAFHLDEISFGVQFVHERLLSLLRLAVPICWSFTLLMPDCAQFTFFVGKVRGLLFIHRLRRLCSANCLILPPLILIQSSFRPEITPHSFLHG